MPRTNQPVQQQQQAPSLYERMAARARVYEAPEVKPATIEHVNEILDVAIMFAKVVRESEHPQYGKSAMIGIVLPDDSVETVWLNEKTVLYRQVMEQLKNGPFLAEIREYESSNSTPKNPRFYYTLATPGSPRPDGIVQAPEHRTSGQRQNQDDSDGMEDLPF